MRKEIVRQLIHLTTGIILAILAFFSSQQVFIIVCVVLMIIGFVGLRLKNKYVMFMLQRFERPSVRDAMPGKGAFAMMFGAVMTAIIFPAQLVPAMLVLGISDSLATIIGLNMGKHKMPWSRKKTMEGTLAFLFSAMAILAFYTPWWALLSVIVTSIEQVEHEKSMLDDNIILPLATGALLMLPWF